MTRKAWSVVDLGFGDAGKGATTDFLCRDREVRLVVRFNGGAQAGHNVVTPDGRHHTFSQFGAGTFAGAHTLLGQDFLLHPLALEVEARHLGPKLGHDPFRTVAVHRQARVITPYQQAANHVRERARGTFAHGTCGVGVGECVADSLSADDTIRAGDLDDVGRVRRLLRRQRDRKRAELLGDGLELDGVFDDDALIDRVASAWADLAPRLVRLGERAFRRRLAGAPRAVFEGAQGVLLDQDWGFHPHTTWSDCTGAVVEDLWDGELVRLGVTRTYQTRHGAGPFPTAGSVDLDESHNDGTGWQGGFRTGALDGMLLRYALDAIGGVDGLCVTHLDRRERGPVCVGYRGLLERFGQKRLVLGGRDDLGYREALGYALRSVEPVLEEVEILGWLERFAPVVLTARGATANDRRWHRADHGGVR